MQSRARSSFSRLRYSHCSIAATGAQFTCFTSAKVQILTQQPQPQERAAAALQALSLLALLVQNSLNLLAYWWLQLRCRHSVCLLYWNISTSTDAATAAAAAAATAEVVSGSDAAATGTQFTCFTGIKVQILTQLQRQRWSQAVMLAAAPSLRSKSVPLYLYLRVRPR